MKTILLSVWYFRRRIRSSDCRRVAKHLLHRSFGVGDLLPLQFDGATAAVGVLRQLVEYEELQVRLLSLSQQY